MEKIIISLTSYPKRINIINKVIESLWKQTISADEIILYLSLDEFPRKRASLPNELVEMIGKRGFQIKWVEGNLKPHKKYYYALRDYDDSCVITVDDDVIYSEKLVSDLYCCHRKNPYAVIARKVRIIIKEDHQLAKYEDWEYYFEDYIRPCDGDLCAIGVGGILYPPGCATERWFDEERMLLLSKNQDDIWLKCNEILDYIPVIYAKPSQDDLSIEDVQSTALWKNNQYENDNCIKKSFDWIRENFSQIYSDWFSAIREREYHILKKKQYYFDIINKFFDEMEGIPVYIYGAGKKAKTIITILIDLNLINKIEAVIVSDKRENPDSLFTLKVKQIDELNDNEKFAVIYGIGEIHKKEVNSILRKYNCQCYNLDIKGIVGFYK